MAKAIRNEIYKLCRNKTLWISAIFTFVLIIGELIFSYGTLCELREIAAQYDDGEMYPYVLSRFWIGGDLASVYNKLYYFLLPIIAVLPFAITYYTDIRTGYMKNICTRIRKKYYILAKYLVAFVSGGLGCSVPLVFNLWLAALYTPNYPQSVILMISPIDNTSLFWDIFYSRPLVYIFIYIGMAFLYGGGFAVLSMAIVYFCRNMFVFAVFPFLINISAYYLLLNTEQRQYVPIAFLNPLQMITGLSYSGIIITYIIMLAVSLIAVHIQIKKDVLL